MAKATVFVFFRFPFRPMRRRSLVEELRVRVRAANYLSWVFGTGPRRYSVRWFFELRQPEIVNTD